jgi:hypothetical protein
MPQQDIRVANDIGHEPHEGSINDNVARRNAVADSDQWVEGEPSVLDLDNRVELGIDHHQHSHFGQ